MYSELEGLSVEEIKRNHADKRYNAKTAGFAINYGGVGITIAKNNNLTLEEGNYIYDSYFKAFPGLLTYFERVKKAGLNAGNILISEFTGRKCYISKYDKFLELKSKINRQYWDTWKIEKIKKESGNITPKYTEMKEEIKEFFNMKGKIERMALNYPIQGKSGEMTKKATVKFFNWIKERNYINTVLIPNTIHDEIIAECPLELAEEVKVNLQRCMEQAGAEYYTRVPLRAEPKISKKWLK